MQTIETSQQKKTNKKRIDDGDEEEDQRYLNQEDEEQECGQNPDDQEVDPLDAFMQEFEEKHPSQSENHQQNIGHQKHKHQIFEDEQQEGFEEDSNYSPNRQPVEEFLSDDNNDAHHPDQAEANRKIIAPLKPVDFSQIHLEDFDKNFYSEHQDIAAMTAEVRKKIMKQFEIVATGMSVPNPITSFGHVKFTDKIMSIIRSQGFEKPTPIQAQALPSALSGRDIVGIAKTGSGKTYAFLWPMIIHVTHQRRSLKGEGPIGLILAPTRELCQQIYVQCKRYGKKEDLRIESLLGGQNKHEQWKRLKAGVDILIASPGRLIQFLRKKATNLIRVTYFVLDEADRMMSLGFEQQIRSIVSQTREDRQTLLFTATMKKSMQLLVGDIINNPIRITVGDQNSANEDVKQEVVVIKSDDEKLQWLEKHIFSLILDGKILIFVNQRAESQELGRMLQNFMKIPVLVIHGDKNQYDRTTIMNQFKADGQVLVATEVAARGIDVKNIKTVINYECPKNIQNYIHRVGRAGRAGETGTAYTFLLPKDVKFAVSLVGIFESSGYPVPDELQDMAILDEGFKRKRFASKMGVSFAKGKDATKYLNHALKRQRRGYSRAGLGLDYNEEKRKYQKKNQLNLNEDVEKLGQNISISQISHLIKSKIDGNNSRQQFFDGKFVKSSKNDMQQMFSEPTISYYQGKKSKKEKKLGVKQTDDL